MQSESAFKGTVLQMNYLGDHAILLSILEPPSKDSILYIQKITVACNELKSVHSWIKDIIPAYQTITLVYDIEIFYRSEKLDPLSFVQKKLPPIIAATNLKLEDAVNKIIKVPVCYELEYGIDLEAIAKLKKLSIESIVEIHTQEVYNVFCLGFMPGFAYMGNVNDQIQVPRQATPRQNVMAGSVGIAGSQTGIYPKNSPGGWQIIGRTPLQIFDHNPSKLALFKVGDQVQFYSIDQATFKKMENESYINTQYRT